jgi:molybdate/tungstate transport system substrate-binding protein
MSVGSLLKSLLIVSFFSVLCFADREKIVVFHAGSLSVPFAAIEAAFEAKYPQYDVQREAYGSRTAARNITELKKPCDVIATADYKVIDELLIESKNASWNALFATNAMVIMYTPRSKFAKEINDKNWFEVIQRNGVNYGHSEPNADPAGYRTMLTWKLAEMYYKKSGLFDSLLKNRPLKNIRPKETDLLALLESGQLDYIFIYESVAKQHKMPYVKLPSSIDLSDPAKADEYKKVFFDITGKAPGEMDRQYGEPIVYGLTIPKNANSPQNPKGAELLVSFVLSSEGLAIMKANAHNPLAKTIIKGNR